MMEQIEIIPYIEFALAGLGVLGFLIMLGMAVFVVEEVDSSSEMKNSEMQNSSSTIKVILSIMLLILGILIILNVVLSFVLHRGVKNRDLKKVNKWFISQCVILALGVLGTVGNMFGDPSVILKNGIFLAYRAWTLYVVKNFAKKLREEGPQDFGAPASFQPMAQE